MQNEGDYWIDIKFILLTTVFQKKCTTKIPTLRHWLSYDHQILRSIAIKIELERHTYEIATLTAKRFFFCTQFSKMIYANQRDSWFEWNWWTNQWLVGSLWLKFDENWTKLFNEHPLVGNQLGSISTRFFFSVLIPDSSSSQIFYIFMWWLPLGDFWVSRCSESLYLPFLWLCSRLNRFILNSKLVVII